jgi:hypothetical protein
MDDKQLIYKLLDSNYRLDYSYLFTILVIDKISNIKINHQKLIHNFELLFGDYMTDSNISSLDIFSQWYQEHLSCLEIEKSDKLEAHKTRFKTLVNFSNKKYNVR